MVELNENKKILCPTEIKSYISLIPGIFLDFRNVFDIVKNLKVIKDNGTVQGDGKVFFNGVVFRIINEKDESGHRWGDGGEIENRTFLERDGERIFASLRFSFYHKYLDDLLDYFYDYRNTYIIKGDEITQGIYFYIKKNLNYQL